MNKLKNLNDIIDESVKILKKMEKNDNICLIHHDDSDGCSSAALFSIICEKLTGSYPFLFPIRGMNNVTKTLINKLKTLNPKYVFVLDVTVDPKKLNEFKGFVLDHHMFNDIKQRKDMPYFNPRIFEKNDEKVPPTSCMMYKILKKIYSDEKVAWIACIGITEDHRVELCKDVFKEVEKEHPGFFKIKVINQRLIENSFFGELWDIVRSGRMIKGINGARTAVLALVECKDRPDKLVNGLTQHSSALRKFYEKLTYETEGRIKNIDKDAVFFRKEKVIFYEIGRIRLSGTPSFFSDKIRQKYPKWIAVVVSREYNQRIAKISIRLEQSERDEDLVAILEEIKGRVSLKGGGHKSAVGATLSLNDVEEFKQEFLKLVKDN